MTFWKSYVAACWGSLAFLLACPLLALVPVALEILQHVVEVHRGMYASLAAAKAADADPVRLAFGFAKVVALLLPTFWVTRYLAWRDPGAAARPDRPAITLFAALLLFEVALSALQLFVIPRTGRALLIGFVPSTLIGALLVAWMAAAPLGNPAIGPIRSIRIMAPRLLSTIALLLLVTLPLMVPHYALGALAILGPKPLLWPVLAVDALLVGWMAALLAAGNFFAARRACELAGVDLVPTQPLPPHAGTSSTAARGRSRSA